MIKKIQIDKKSIYLAFILFIITFFLGGCEEQPISTYYEDVEVKVVNAYRDSHSSLMPMYTGGSVAFYSHTSTTCLVSFEYNGNVFNIDNCSVWENYYYRINEIVPAKLEVNNYEDGTQTIAIVVE